MDRQMIPARLTHYKRLFWYEYKDVDFVMEDGISATHRFPAEPRSSLSQSMLGEITQRIFLTLVQWPELGNLQFYGESHP